MGNDKSKLKKPDRGSGPPQVKTDSNPTVATLQKMRTTIQQLEKRKDFINKKIEKEVLEAKKKAKENNKKAALMHIKRKKLFEKEFTKLENAILNLEQQHFAIEAGSTNIDVVNAMKQGLEAQKAVNQRIDVDNVAALSDDIQEMQAEQEEVNELLSNPMGNIADDDDLEAELAALGDEMIDEAGISQELPTVPTQIPTIKLPQAPTHTPKKTQEELTDEAALAELQAEMSK